MWRCCGVKDIANLLLFSLNSPISHSVAHLLEFFCILRKFPSSFPIPWFFQMRREGAAEQEQSRDRPAGNYKNKCAHVHRCSFPDTEMS